VVVDDVAAGSPISMAAGTATAFQYLHDLGLVICSL
jgi:hypothetical protein